MNYLVDFSKTVPRRKRETLSDAVEILEEVRGDYEQMVETKRN